MKRALVIGITGQDGSYLAEQLLEDGYEVHGVVRRSSSINTARIDHVYGDPRLRLHFGDLTDGQSLARIVREVRPDEVFNLGAQSHVRVSFDVPEYTADAGGLGTLRLLEAVREHAPEARFYQASSSEMFGSSPPPQSEETPFRPRSPYAAAKLYAHWTAVNYREAYGMRVSCGILFNHTSERRGETFVERKITRAAARIKLGLQDRLRLGNLDARRDWGWAPDYVRAMRLMVAQDEPGDYVVATGTSYSVRDVLNVAFGRLDMNWNLYVDVDSRYFRPTEVEVLEGDARRARERLGWAPTVGFEEIVARMVDADLALARRDVL